jgi:hypothetical protein
LHKICGKRYRRSTLKGASGQNGINSFRYKCVTYEIRANTVNIRMDIIAMLYDVFEINYSDGKIDPVLIEIIAACHYLMLSPSIQELETCVRRELALPKIDEYLSIR